MAEIWKALLGWEPYYEVSDSGKVRSVPRLRPDYRGTDRKYAGKLLNIQTSPNGYSVVYLSVRGSGRKRKRAYLHRLVLETFVGPCPPGYWCAHNNGVRADCNLSNLRWDTPANNQADKKKHGTYAFGRMLPWARLRESQVKTIRRGGRSDGEFGRMFGVDAETVRSARLRKSWRHVP